MIKWDSSRVATLINAQAGEGETLEFKAELPPRNDRGKAEFLKDVSALANSAGGTIIFGISEEKGAATALSLLQLPDADAEIRRLSQILESGIEPRIAGIQFDVLTLGESQVLVIDVPQSFDAPHRYIFNGHSKFVQRNGTHVSELSYDQLRAAFDRSSDRMQRLRADWEEDFGLSNLWKPIIDGPVCVARLAPLISADRRQILDPKSAYDHWVDLIFPGWGGGSSAFNYNGLVVFPGRQDSLPAMAQICRSGAMSAFRTGRALSEDGPLIPSVVVGNFFVEAAKKLAKFSRDSGLAGSAVLFTGITRLTGYKFASTDSDGFGTLVDSKYHSLALPEAWIDDLTDEDLSMGRLLRPALDVLWQAYGLSECPHFDSSGEWKPPH